MREVNPNFFDYLLCDSILLSKYPAEKGALKSIDSKQLVFKSFGDRLGVFSYGGKINSGIPVINFFPLFQLSHDGREAFCTALAIYNQNEKDAPGHDFMTYYFTVCPKLTWQVKPDMAACKAAFPQPALWQELFNVIRQCNSPTSKESILQKAFHDTAVRPLEPYAEGYDFQTLFCEVTMNLLHVYLKLRHSTPRLWRGIRLTHPYRRDATIQINHTAQMTNAPYLEMRFTRAFHSGLANILDAVQEDLLAHTSLIRGKKRDQIKSLVNLLHRSLCVPQKIAPPGALSLSDGQAGHVSLSQEAGSLQLLEDT